MVLFYWGEESPNAPRNKTKKSTGTPSPVYRKPNYNKAEKRWIDPHTVKWANTPVNETFVRAYEQNPNRRSDDGDPFVVVNKNGVAEGWNGKHRATAAMRQHRKLKVRYWDVRGE
jgi:hypothetical protein